MDKNLARQYEPQNELQKEFEAKNELLRSRFPELSPMEYLETIFPDKGDEDNLIVVFGTIKDKKGNIIENGTVGRIKFCEVWDIAWRSNAYIPYCSFKKDYYHSRTLETVRAFVVDLDNVSPRNLRQILNYVFKQIPLPTHVINSGKGFHFVYALNEPVKVKGLRWTLNTLNEAIQEAFKPFASLDKHPLVHPYRFPGFMTKINTVATAFKVKSTYTLEELLKLFKLNPKKSSVKTEKKESSGNKAKILFLPNGSRHFFEWFIWQLFKRPPYPGKRHNSFFALGIVSYKCRRYVPYEEAIDVVDMVYDGMERLNLHIGFTREEAHRAFQKGYNPKAVRVRWKFICGLLDWEYRPNKRNGRKREEHLRYLQKIRQIQKEEKEEHIKRLLARGYTKTEIAEMLGITRQNLYKTYGHLFK
nr:hypothetical protein [uncultured bacterium]AUH21285.1 hypothetical protein [uncultured bacterium]AUH21290.1 hypothetical protein [uncultured bacterium]AUH21295.1 hypothetical protein [uncultured bacterium]AUH21301.1 hypothetical protein [uncultured bacterium]